jgi:hypothetical protein
LISTYNFNLRTGAHTTQVFVSVYKTKLNRRHGIEIILSPSDAIVRSDGIDESSSQLNDLNPNQPQCGPCVHLAPRVSHGGVSLQVPSNWISYSTQRPSSSKTDIESTHLLSSTAGARDHPYIRIATRSPNGSRRFSLALSKSKVGDRAEAEGWSGAKIDGLVVKRWCKVRSFLEWGSSSPRADADGISCDVPPAFCQGIRGPSIGSFSPQGVFLSGAVGRGRLNTGTQDVTVDMVPRGKILPNYQWD